MGARNLNKIAQKWVDSVSTELESVVQLTEEQLVARKASIEANVNGIADTSVVNPQVTVGTLCENAEFIMGNTYKANGREPPESVGTLKG